MNVVHGLWKVPQSKKGQVPDALVGVTYIQRDGNGSCHRNRNRGIVTMRKRAAFHLLEHAVLVGPGCV